MHTIHLRHKDGFYIITFHDKIQAIDEKLSHFGTQKEELLGKLFKEYQHIPHIKFENFIEINEEAHNDGPKVLDTLSLMFRIK